LIKGHFVPKAGRPDGDSVRFRAEDLQNWNSLEGRPPEIGTGATTAGTAQLRFEGIDAIEKAAIEPLATDAKASMFRLIGHHDADGNVVADEPSGCVLARMTDDKSGRPIAFVFAETPAALRNKPDGASDIFLGAALLRESVNYRQMQAGYAYPLYYNTLFAALRREFDKALTKAKDARRGYWSRQAGKSDATLSGVRVAAKADLETIAPVWPKLWRRLEEFFRAEGASLSGFKAFLEAKNERLDVLSEMEERGLQDVVEVKAGKVRLTEPPENLRVRGKAGRRG
jgi:endonuclease YncB( thermonuclease family)